MKKNLIILLCFYGYFLAGCTTQALYRRYPSKTVVLFEEKKFDIHQLDPTRVEMEAKNIRDLAQSSMLHLEDGYYPFSPGLKLAEMVFFLPLYLAVYPIVFPLALINQKWRMIYLPFLLFYPLKNTWPSRGGIKSTGRVLNKKWTSSFKESIQTLPYTRCPITFWKKSLSKKRTIYTDKKGRATIDLQKYFPKRGLVIVEPQGASYQFHILWEKGNIRKIVKVKNNP